MGFSDLKLRMEINQEYTPPTLLSLVEPFSPSLSLGLELASQP
jgi:hypothetical protein